MGDFLFDHTCEPQLLNDFEHLFGETRGDMKKNLNLFL